MRVFKFCLSLPINLNFHQLKLLIDSSGNTTKIFSFLKFDIFAKAY